MRDALFWDVVGDFLRFCERSNSLVKVKYVFCGVFFFLQHELRMEEAMSRILKSRHLCPALAKAMMASRCSCRSPVDRGALTSASLTCGSEAILFLAASLVSHSAAGCRVSASAPSCLCRLNSLRVRGMCTLARAPRNQGCGPVLPTFC